ncbi:MAG: M2 family metallopeptidase [Marinilabiliales bacterium]|nr:M2 family metallopeptidase [Marinilabiliales bacterium]
MMRRVPIYLFVVLTMLWSCTSKQEKMENRMREFISAYEAKIIPLYRENALASWEANINGTDEAWARSEKATIEYVSFFVDPVAFRRTERDERVRNGNGSAPCQAA